MPHPKRSIKSSFAILAVSFSAAAQITPGLKQESKNSPCSNIVALAGNATINCSSLTPTQRKIIEAIPSVLHKILINQLDPDAVMVKLDEILQGVREIRGNSARLDAKTTELSSRRTLTEEQQQIIYQSLIDLCPAGTLHIALVWEPFDEPSDYAGYFLNPLNASKCLALRTELLPKPPLFKGVVLRTLDWNHPSKDAQRLRAAFDKALIKYTLENGDANNHPVMIVIGIKP